MNSPQTELIFSQEGSELLRVQMPPGEYVIGRNPDCDIRVPTELISRSHARLTVNYQEIFIEDLGSSNGTFVAGERIAECTRVFPTQVVSLGAVIVDIRRPLPAPRSLSISPHAVLLDRHLPGEHSGPRRYTAGRLLAQGGMGAILDGEDKVLKRKVAIKRMLNANAEQDLVRFIEEAQITAQLDHPNIVPLYELGLDEHEQLYYTMKLVRGVTLTQVLSQLRQQDPEALEKYTLSVLLGIVQKVCDGLAFAHSKGVLHRDLKPDNIMLGEYGEVMVMDWGLARASGRKQGSGPQRTFVRSARQEQGQNTMVGLVLGSPQYMSPEQARGESQTYDARTDIYALGSTLYQILTLEPPISGNDVGEMLMSVAVGNVGQFLSSDAGPKKTPESKNFPHLPGGRIPPALGAITRKAMALQQEDRYASVQELQVDLKAFQGGMVFGSTDGAKAGAGNLVRIQWIVIGVLFVACVALAMLLVMKANG